MEPAVKLRLPKGVFRCCVLHMYGALPGLLLGRGFSAMKMQACPFRGTDVWQNILSDELTGCHALPKTEEENVPKGSGGAGEKGMI